MSGLRDRAAGAGVYGDGSDGAGAGAGSARVIYARGETPGLITPPIAGGLAVSAGATTTDIDARSLSHQYVGRAVVWNTSPDSGVGGTAGDLLGEEVAMFRADDIASVVIARSGPWVDAMSLQKLLYYVQAWHVAITDQPLFSEEFHAYRDGPVVPQVRRARMDKRTRRSSGQHIEHIQLDQLSSNLIDLVIASYGSMTGQELSALTHVELPWNEARGDLPADAPCQNVISLETMARFYRAERRLGGRTAADLASGGVFVAQYSADALDVDALLQEIGHGFDVDDVDPWGSANLDDPKRYEHAAHRS